MVMIAGFALLFLAVNIQSSLQWRSPNLEMAEKAAHKSHEIPDQPPPITLNSIKTKLKDTGIFDWQDPTLTDVEKKEMSKLFEAVEIMTTSRNRQPGNVQQIFSALRIVERAVKKQLKEGQLSESFAARFHWDRITSLENLLKLRDAFDTNPFERLNQQTDSYRFDLQREPFESKSLWFPKGPRPVAPMGYYYDKETKMRVFMPI